VTTLLSFAFVLGVLIFVHELGHFLMARRIGVRVLTFSLGFGPKIVKFRRGDTEYCLSAIPLGGYVKMAGENPHDGPTGAPDEFLSKTKWQRFQVLVMGPVMNLVLAVIITALVLQHGIEVPAFETESVVVGAVAEGTAAQTAGIQPGDRIVAVNGVEVPNWERFSSAILPMANRRVEITIDRGGRTERVTLVPASVGKYELGNIGVRPNTRPQIVLVTPDAPADQAGLRQYDVLLAVDGERGLTGERATELINNSGGRPLTFEVERAGARQTVTVTPRVIGDAHRIGVRFSPYEMRIVRPGPIDAVVMSIERNWEVSRATVLSIGGLFTRETSVKQLLGPVAIADLTGTAASQGWVELFTLMGMISLSLGLLNLMPIPVLDGGHIAILAMEAVARRDFSMKVKEQMLAAGFVLLLTLMATVIYNDLMRIAWIERLLPWR
jgi:regulator of sigma E protease